MPNEPRGGHGERIATLESGYEHLVNRINHLDDCVDGVKVQAEKMPPRSIKTISCGIAAGLLV